MSTFFRAFPRQWNANYVWSPCHILRPVPYNTGNSSAQCAICPKMKRGQKKKNRKSICIDSTCTHSVSVDTLLYTKNVQRNKFDWSIYVCSAFDTIFCRLCGSFINQFNSMCGLVLMITILISVEISCIREKVRRRQPFRKFVNFFVFHSILTISSSSSSIWLLLFVTCGILNTLAACIQAHKYMSISRKPCRQCRSQSDEMEVYTENNQSPYIECTAQNFSGISRRDKIRSIVTESDEQCSGRCARARPSDQVMTQRNKKD